MIEVVWFKRDLRTTDHRPLAQAAASGAVLPLYVVEPEYWRLPDTSTRQWLALRSALVELSERLTSLGAPLIVRVGRVTDVLQKIHAAVGISRLLAQEETGNLWTFRRDLAVRAFCDRQRIPFEEYSQTGVIRGAGARSRWAAHFTRFIDEAVVPEPAWIQPVPAARVSAIPTTAALGLQSDGCIAPQSGTRRCAIDLLDSFFAGRGADYRQGMSSPLGAASCCSRLSVPLATGAISVREVLRYVYAERERLQALPLPQRPVSLTAVASLVARLHWRGHFMQKLESEPEAEARSFHPAHEQARSSAGGSDDALAAWAAGQTGIPFIDACMRSLIDTGWLNFRMRAMLQSFASHHLDLDWRASGEQLAQRFTDYEPGIHWPQVQMQSGQTGINTPRIYNPVKQGLDQDPDGRFTRQWLPELAGVPLPLLQTPWCWEGSQNLRYPAPIIDHLAAARAAKARLTSLRHSAGYPDAALEVFRKHGSRGRRFEQGRGRTPDARPAAPSQGLQQLNLFAPDAG